MSLRCGCLAIIFTFVITDLQFKNTYLFIVDLYDFLGTKTLSKSVYCSSVFLSVAHSFLRTVIPADTKFERKFGSVKPHGCSE